jgi:cytoskeletal protein CcmA (bactofilin family)
MLDQRVNDSSASVPDQFHQVHPGSTPRSSVASVSAQSTIGKSVVIKGEITGSESVHIEGTVEGLIALPDDRVTVGTSGKVTADITAQDIVVFGELTGTCEASDLFYVRGDGSFCGNIVASRISIEDGACLTGTIDIRKRPASPVKAAEASAVEEETVEVSHVN